MAGRMKTGWDYADILTKEDLILFLKIHCFFQTPKQYEIDFFKWERESERLLEEMGRYTADNSGSVLAREYDSIAAAFNSAKDLKTCGTLMKKLRVVRDKLEARHKKWDAIMRRQEKNDEFLRKAKAWAGMS